MIVVLILLSALVLILSNREARLERVAAGGGEPSRAMAGFRFVERVGGRWETQSWTRRETRGFERRFRVFLEAAFVVMIIVGWEVKGVEGR